MIKEDFLLYMFFLLEVVLLVEKMAYRVNKVEHMAITKRCKEAIWLKRVLGDRT